MSSNINPAIWGSAGWTFLRNIAKGYPDNPTEEDKIKYRKYFELVGEVLPCEKCRASYKEHWKQVSIDNFLINKNNLYQWVNIIKSKTKPANNHIRSKFISERIQRIKNNRMTRAKNRGKCGGCGKKRAKKVPQ